MAEEEDFFSMLENAATNRLDDQRSESRVHDAPLIYNFDLLKNELTGGALAVSNDREFPCNYLGHQQSHLQDDKEALCNTTVWNFCKGLATKKGGKNKEPFQNIVRVDATGIEFTIGAKGAAKVLVPLRQVACVSLCPKRKGGPLKIVAILCRSALHRLGKPVSGELEMTIHMCRLKDSQTMWKFQQAFVNALKIAFPQHHKSPDKKKKTPTPQPSPKKQDLNQVKEPSPAQFDSNPVNLDDSPQKDGGYLHIGKEDFNPRDGSSPKPDRSSGATSSSPQVIISPVKKKKAYVHKVFVKSKEQTLEADAVLAKKLQQREEQALVALNAQEQADQKLVKSLQEEEDAKFAQTISFDDDEPDLP